MTEIITTIILLCDSYFPAIRWNEEGYKAAHRSCNMQMYECVRAKRQTTPQGNNDAFFEECYVDFIGVEKK